MYFINIKQNNVLEGIIIICLVYIYTKITFNVLKTNKNETNTRLEILEYMSTGTPNHICFHRIINMKSVKMAGMRFLNNWKMDDVAVWYSNVHVRSINIRLLVIEYSVLHTTLHYTATCTLSRRQYVFNDGNKFVDYH